MPAPRSASRRIAAVGHRVAITGTPGTGKSSIARSLPSSWQAVEVGDLAVRLGAGTRRASDVLVDLPKLARALRRSSMGDRLVLVGHLAHLLPVREVVVLRCD